VQRQPNLLRYWRVAPRAPSLEFRSRAECRSAPGVYG
jgi:hypothetical protein